MPEIAVLRAPTFLLSSKTLAEKVLFRQVRQIGAKRDPLLHSCFILRRVGRRGFSARVWLPRSPKLQPFIVNAAMTDQSKAKQSPTSRDCFGAMRCAMTNSRSRVRRAFSTPWWRRPPRKTDETFVRVRRVGWGYRACVERIGPKSPYKNGLELSDYFRSLGCATNLPKSVFRFYHRVLPA